MGTNGELPIAPVALLSLSNALMRMAMPKAPVVNANIDKSEKLECAIVSAWTIFMARRAH